MHKIKFKSKTHNSKHNSRVDIINEKSKNVNKNNIENNPNKKSV